MPDKEKSFYEYRLPLGYEGDCSQATAHTIKDGMKEQTTAHGIPHISIARGKFKITTWSIITCGFVSVLLYHMTIIFQSYFAYNVKVKVEMLTGQQQDFPAVTVCNMCPVKRSALKNDPVLAAIYGIEIDDLKKRRRKRALGTDCGDSRQFDPYTGICYGLINSGDLMNYEDAKKSCAEDGGALAIIDSTEKNSFLQSGDIFSGAPNTGDYYVDVRYNTMMGTYALFDTVEMDSGNFNPWKNSPDYRIGDCVYADSTDSHVWYNVDCADNQKMALCQKFHTCLYETYGSTEICWFLWDIKSLYTKSEAENICKASGAKLPVLDTEDKMNHFAKIQAMEKASDKNYWINLTPDSSRTYYWEGTIPLTWTYWGSTSETRCVAGSTERSHQWIFGNCASDKFAVICEWEAKTTTTTTTSTTTTTTPTTTTTTPTTTTTTPTTTTTTPTTTTTTPTTTTTTTTTTTPTTTTPTTTTTTTTPTTTTTTTTPTTTTTTPTTTTPTTTTTTPTTTTTTPTTTTPTTTTTTPTTTTTTPTTTTTTTTTTTPTTTTPTTTTTTTTPTTTTTTPTTTTTTPTTTTTTPTTTTTTSPTTSTTTPTTTTTTPTTSTTSPTTSTTTPTTSTTTPTTSTTSPTTSTTTPTTTTTTPTTGTTTPTTTTTTPTTSTTTPTTTTTSPTTSTTSPTTSTTTPTTTTTTPTTSTTTPTTSTTTPTTSTTSPTTSTTTPTTTTTTTTSPTTSTTTPTTTTTTPTTTTTTPTTTTTTPTTTTTTPTTTTTTPTTTTTTPTTSTTTPTTSTTTPSTTTTTPTTTTTTPTTTTTTPTTTTQVYTTTTKSIPQPINGSKFPERIEPRQEFKKVDLAIEAIAAVSEEDKKAVGFQTDEFILDCEYAGYTCLTSQLSFFYNSIHGNCYMFNSGWNETFPKRIARGTGRRHGLKMMVNIAQDEYVSAFGEGAGARVVIHSQDRMPFPEDEGLLAKVGQLTTVGVRKVMVQRLPKPWGECRNIEGDNSDINQYEELYPTSYSTSACYKTCYQYWMIRKCGCADPFYPMTGKALYSENIKGCSSSNITQDDCKYEVNLEYMNDKLVCSCPMACFEQLYIPSVSYSNWPSDINLNHTLKRVKSKIPQLFSTGSKDKYKRNLLKIEIFFEHFNYEKITEKESYTKTSFISSIGGVLGLWMGFSVLTIFEFVEFFTDLSVYVWKKKKKIGAVEAFSSDLPCEDDQNNDAATETDLPLRTFSPDMSRHGSLSHNDYSLPGTVTPSSISLRQPLKTPRIQ